MAHTRTLAIDGTFTLADLDELIEQIKNTASPTKSVDLKYIGWSDQARRRFKGKVTVVFEELAWAPDDDPS
jgi:hypothetical protein